MTLVKMYNYPSYMVPYIGLNKKVNVDALLKCGNFAIARRVDELQFYEKDFLKEQDGTGSYILSAHSELYENIFVSIPNLSMTMLRQECPIENAKYKLEKPGADDWNGKDVFPQHYCGKAIMTSRSYLIVYEAEYLHGQPVEYQKKFSEKKTALEVQDKYEGLKDDIVMNQFTKDKEYNGKGHIFLQHSPTMLNYWHYELKLEDSEGKEINSVNPIKDSGKKNKNQSFVEYVRRNYLCKHFWINKNPCEDIPIECFYDNDCDSTERDRARKNNEDQFARVPIVLLDSHQD